MCVIIDKNMKKNQKNSFLIWLYDAVKYIFYGWFIPLLFVFKNRPNHKTKYYFSLCAIFKNESRYFREWIEYHRMLGVEHLYLYNNFSTDDYAIVLKPYIDEGYVTLTDWPYELSQISAYQHCYENYRDETFWLMFLDLDEFICPIYKTNIKDWIKSYEKYPSVLMYWLMFGTNGIVKEDSNKLVIEQYTNSWASVRNESKQVLNTSYTPVKVYHHVIWCWMTVFGIKIKVPSVNERRKFIYNHGKEKCPLNGTIQINHYWSKSLSEYVRKIEKGDVFSKSNDEIRKDMSFFYWHENKNVAENKVIFRFIAELKMRMLGIEILFK